MNEGEMKIYKQISVDVPRTMPEYKLFSYERIRKMMLRLLYIWSMRHPASGYVQGFNDLCTPFIAILILQYCSMDIDSIDCIKEEGVFGLGESALLEIEADSYYCFTKMMNRIQNNYTNNQPGLTKMITKMEDIIKTVDNELYEHLIENNISFMQFSFRWMNCYLMREFGLKQILRIWDTYFSEEDAFNNFHIYVCASLLLSFSEKLKKMTEFQEMIMFLQNLQITNWQLDDVDVLLAKAYQICSLYGNKLK
jgi:hypothetical protein